MIRKLRERGEPITLFGETHYEAYLRLKKLESLMPDVLTVSIHCIPFYVNGSMSIILSFW